MKYTITVDVPDELAAILHLGETRGDSVPPPDEPPEGDPWDSPGAATQAAAARVESSDQPAQSVPTAEAIAAALASLGLGGQAASTAPASTSGGIQTFQVQGRNGMTNWTVGRPDAPQCGCRLPAAYVTGTTNGKPWARWTCPKGRDSNDKTKCKFNQFA